jgi:cytochrome c oxidase assembly protein Cox11
MSYGSPGSITLSYTFFEVEGAARVASRVASGG